MSGHNQATTPWTPEIDEYLLSRVAEVGPRWKKLSREITERFGVRVSHDATDRHFRVLEKRKAADLVAEQAVQEEQGLTEESYLDRNKDKLKARFESRLLQDLLDKQSRTEQIIEALKETIATLPRVEVRLLPEPKTGDGTPQTCILPVSDVHVGQVVNPLEVGGLNAYNFDIFRERAERWQETSRSIIRHQQQAHPARELEFWMIGDMVEGDRIFKSQRLYMDLDLMQQLFRSVDIWAEKIVSFLDLFGHITVRAVPGNHGRIGDKGDNKSYVNWDYVLARCVEMKLAEYRDRISFDIPESFFIVTQVEGWNWLIWHGDDIKSWASIPWYGVQRSATAWVQMFNIMGRRFDYAIHGHFHTEFKMDFMVGELFANGSWVGTNEHALRIRAFGHPKQMALFCHPAYGVTSRHPILLADPRRELAEIA